MTIVSLLMLVLLAAGVRVPGAGLARGIASRMLCAAALADGCGDEPALIATYGDEVGRLVRRHMPMLAFEDGSRALPVDFRRCRSTTCGDGSARGLVHRTDRNLPVTVFVHVVDCRDDAEGARGAQNASCSGPRAGNLYIQYWTYYADSATLRGVPVVGRRGYHHDDWEQVGLRFLPDGSVDERASSHGGYNYAQSRANWGSDAAIGPLKGAAEGVGARRHNGWGPETHILLVSGGSHAGNATGFPNFDRVTPGRRVHLVPLEPIARGAEPYDFAISPPWRKQVWLDPEAEGTG
ncbi:MAG TPA: hypothetical protein VGF04_08660 [Solirubrobacterales bacterium]